MGDPWDELVEDSWNRGRYPIVVRVRPSLWEGSLYALDGDDLTGRKIPNYGTGYGANGHGVTQDMLRLVLSDTNA